jgi:type VI secretion system protein ImpK
MRKEIADIVFPIFRKAIEIKEGLRGNEKAWNFVESQKKLLALLQAPVPDPLRADFFGDQRSMDSSVASHRIGFLGIRYALACWLDEIFITDSPWNELWNVNKFETTLYGMLDRAAEFWAQMKRAQTRPTQDALEVYYLCFMLGFRGDKIGKVSELNAERENAETQVMQAEGREYNPPPGLAVPPNVPPLKGNAVMAKWAITATIIALMFIPLVVFWLSKLGS